MVRGTLTLRLSLTRTRCEKNCVGDKWRSTMATATNDGLHGCVDGRLGLALGLGLRLGLALGLGLG